MSLNAEITPMPLHKSGSRDSADPSYAVLEAGV